MYTCVHTHTHIHTWEALKDLAANRLSVLHICPAWRRQSISITTGSNKCAWLADTEKKAYAEWKLCALLMT